MGAVGKTVYSDVKVEGYPIEGEIYYIYCERCGSFRIRTHLRAIHWLGLVALLAAAAGGWNYMINTQTFYGNESYGCWIIYLLFAAVMIGWLARYFPHQCIQCGNTNITYADVLAYQDREDWERLMDVPEAKLHQHENGNPDLISDLKLIPLFVLAIILALLYPFILLVAMLIEYIYSTIKEKIEGRRARGPRHII